MKKTMRLADALGERGVSDSEEYSRVNPSNRRLELPVLTMRDRKLLTSDDQLQNLRGRGQVVQEIRDFEFNMGSYGESFFPCH